MKTFTQIILLASIVLYSFGPIYAQVVNCGTYSSSPSGAITDAAVLTDDIITMGTGPNVIADLDVAIQITHTWTEDMDITLTSPTATVGTSPTHQ